MSGQRECPTCAGYGDLGFEAVLCKTCDGTGMVPVVPYCATCGNPADNPDYRKNCCQPDNMIKD